MIVLQFSIREVVPSTGVSVQQRGRFDGLFPVLASLAFESVVSFAKCVLIELKELSESIYREVSLGVFLLVDDGGG